MAIIGGRVAFPHNPKTTGAPDISIVVPVWNEKPYLATCLEGILQSDLPASSYEVLIVDGGSTDGSREIAEEFAARHANVFALSNPERIPATAMNRGIRRARGKYIIRMDAHAQFPPSYARACVEELERTGADNVGFASETQPSGATAVARAIAWFGQHPLGVGPSAFRLGWGDRDVDTVPFGAFRRTLFERVGLYREDLVRHEDFELNARIRAAGGRVYLSRKVRSVYFARPTLAGFCRQAALNGLWNARSWVRYRGCFAWRHAMPMFLVLSLLATAAAGIFWRASWWTALAIAGAYAVMLLAVGVQLAFRHGWRYLFVAPVVFAAHQLPYGIMEMVGLLSVFSLRWRGADSAERLEPLP